MNVVWIKVENTTADKPEVIILADMLKMEQDSVFGKLVKLWLWADQNTVDGNVFVTLEALQMKRSCNADVTDLYASSVAMSMIDRVVGYTGFASALVAVGWLEVFDGGLRFVNFDRHNGKSGKLRALNNRRMANYRAKTCNDSVTHEVLQPRIPDKRRVDKRRYKDQDKDLAPEGASGEVEPKTKQPSKPEPVIEIPEPLKYPLQVWIDYRTKIKKPIKAPTVTALIKKWASEPERFAAAVAHTIENGWQGLFEPKPGYSKKYQPRGTEASVQTVIEILKEDDNG